MLSLYHVMTLRVINYAYQLMARWKPDAAGRLTKAAITLFAEQGYEATTIAEIAEGAGLTKRTFFRYFADKREVLFSGAQELERIWLNAAADAPRGSCAFDVATTGLGPVAELFRDRHDLARVRTDIITANPELQERELIKLQRLARAIELALVERGFTPNVSALAAQSAVTVFHVAFGAWVQQDDPKALGRLMAEALSELRAVTAG